MPSENAHAALIVNNIVLDIGVIPYLGDDDEKITAYMNEIGFPGKWIDCSRIGARRGRYPNIGDRYDPELDEFIGPVE